MHSRIFQISETPVKKDEYITSDYYYDNPTVLNMSDYTSDDTDRSEDIEWLKEYMDGVLEFNGDSFTVINRKNYFTEKFNGFKEQLAIIQARLDMDYFMSDKTNKNDIDFDMYELKTAYEDKLSFWADTEDWGIIPMDKFMRDAAKEGETYYIGGTVDYHF